MKFGFKIIDLYHHLTTSPNGQAPTPAEVPSAMVSYQEMPDEFLALEWAELTEVFNYLRQNRHMVIPREWASLVPKPLL